MSNDSQSDPRLERSAASDDDIQSVHAELIHAQSEPDQGYSLMPLFMLGFVSTMIFVVAIFFIHNRGGLTEGLSVATTITHPGYDPETAAPVEVAEIDPMVAGKRLYDTTCIACHQGTGGGVPGVYPPLVNSDWVTGDEDRVIRVLLHGLTGPIEVAGQTYGVAAMPAFGAGSTYNWNDERISWVLTYIRNSWGNEASAITAEQVAAVAAAGERSSEWTVEELLALP